MLLKCSRFLIPVLSLAWASQTVCARTADDDERAARQTSFEAVVRPLVQTKCLKCHSGTKPKGDLDLSTAAGILKGGESGQVINPGKPDESLLFEKIHNGSMPPDKKSRLTETEVEEVRRWILAGAALGRDKSSQANSSRSLNQHDVLPILLRHCTACHNADRSWTRSTARRPCCAVNRSGHRARQAGDQSASQAHRCGPNTPPERLVEAGVKPVAEAELDLIWVDRGGRRKPTSCPTLLQLTRSTGTDKDREFWSFRSPQTVGLRHPHTGQIQRHRSVVLKELETRHCTRSEAARRSSAEHPRLDGVSYPR